MSKQVDITVNCPLCGNQFETTLYRSIWGEYPDNRELVFSDRINVKTCPGCTREVKLPLAFLYTNRDIGFAVWYEPYHDEGIDTDARGYASVMGPGSYLATAPRVRDWEEFKETICKFEQGYLKGGEIEKLDLNALKAIAEAQNANRARPKAAGCASSIIIVSALIGFAFRWIFDA